ncbi:hypothetical protein [Amycolatopsis sp. NPDC051061]|uniref:hypothetical protein n=1 Tax=Amycolatopsis sp. NPDC051061 TaxID=3155042 RepID=UPI00342F9E7D
MVTPEVFDRIERAGIRCGMPAKSVRQGLVVITKVVLRTGRPPEELVGDDIVAYRTWDRSRAGRCQKGEYAAWDLLRDADIFRNEPSLKEVLLKGQWPTTELVDRHAIQCEHVRDALVRYLDERRPGLDYGSLRNLASILAGLFWADVERHHPGIESLHLPNDVAADWKVRLALITKPGQPPRARRSLLHIYTQVRSFYLDIQEWATEDPSWVPHAVPCPIRAGETDGQVKARKKTIATMHQRVRDRLPHLLQLVEAAERDKSEQAALLNVAKATPVGATFLHDNAEYIRVHIKNSADRVVIREVATGTQVDIVRRELEAFYAWAIIETLRHTGVRLEELLGITHLALVSYRVPATGEVVPLLQIVPSKSNEERLLVVSPELASVFASIVTRLRADNGGTIPLAARYDTTERLVEAPLPHLFQHKLAWRPTVLSGTTVYKMLKQTLELASVTDAAGQPLHYTPHDFRRISPARPSPAGCPSISQPGYSATPRSPPRRPTSRSSRKT